MARKLPASATILTTAAVIILCALGTWQIQRLAWKNEIIEQLDAAYANQGKAIDISKMQDRDYAYGQITGIFRFDKSLAFGHRVSKDSVAGHSLVTPLETNQGTLLVNLGFNPNKRTLSEHPLKAYQGQEVTFSGLLRPPSWNLFTPENDPQKDSWYRYDVEQIASINGLENPIPYILYADSASPQLSYGYPDNERWYPNNNHAQYAFFWFTLAATLIIIFILRFKGKRV